MEEKILQMVDAYWKFDNQQQPISSWHDKQDLLKALEELLQPAADTALEAIDTVISHYEKSEKIEFLKSAKQPSEITHPYDLSKK